MGTVCFDGGYVIQMTPEKYYICPICNFRITDEKMQNYSKGYVFIRTVLKNLKKKSTLIRSYFNA